MSGIRFCPECLNILVPMEADKQLAFKCKSCRYQDIPSYREDMEFDKSDNLIYKREFAISGATENTDPDFALDPTMPRNKGIECPKCGFTEAVFFLDKDSTEKKLRLRYICGRVYNGRPDCGNSWAADEM